MRLSVSVSHVSGMSPYTTHTTRYGDPLAITTWRQSILRSRHVVISHFQGNPLRHVSYISRTTKIQH